MSHLHASNEITVLSIRSLLMHDKSRKLGITGLKQKLAEQICFASGWVNKGQLSFLNLSVMGAFPGEVEIL